MNLSSVRVSPNSTVEIDRVEGDLYVSENSTVKAKDGREVTVTGTVHCEGDCTFDCSVSAFLLRGRDGEITVYGDLLVDKLVRVTDGSLIVEGNLSAVDVEVDKELNVRGNLTVEKVNVGGKLKIGGDAKARDVDVGGAFEAYGKVETEKMDVGGTFRGKGLVKADSVNVGGSFHAEAEILLKVLDVGGTVEIAGGEADKIDVGGTLRSTRPLTFNLIDVGGSVRLTGPSKGGRVSVGGTLKVDGDITFSEIDVGGTVEILGNADGADIDVGGKLAVSGSLMLTRKLDVGGLAEVGERLNAKSIEVGGALRARRIEAVALVDVGGEIITFEGLKANRVKIGRRGKIRGVVVAEEVGLEERAEAEDIYASIMFMEKESRARNVYGKRVRLENCCRIMGELQYTEDLKAEEGVYFTVEPKKVDRLPAAPI